jgi:D-alanine transaminase
MRILACLNGRIMPADEARVPIFDRGFLFGDSIYEVFRLYQGRAWLEEAHYARLGRSLRAIEIHGIDLEGLAGRVRETVSASEIQEGIVYIQITRGVAPRHHHYPGAGVPPTELVVVWPYDDASAARLRREGVAAVSQADLRWGRCDVKSTNLLANVMANEAAHRAGALEAILVAEDGRVTEATHSSVLWVRGGRLEGTPETPGILPGTTRHLLLRLAQEEGVAFAAAEVTLDELKAADEALLLGTGIEIFPIVKIDQTSISGGRPGPVTMRLQAAYRRAVERWLAGKPPGSPESQPLPHG